MMALLDLVSFDKYTYYIWFSYFLTFAVISVLFFRTKSLHEKAIIQLRIKYSRGK
ncbi:MAG: heme exporter protein CcmD [Candidatus Ruthia sp.]|jgi:heme exporter protein D|nr:heme exporter protein CcmD [Candidatus Ruthturnera sp.]MBT4122682.1 heme exporter protein CcmD [Candidatus Ruthturnera sp.]MBT6921859.1 heme exporter protein CcmD [Candidatus Ruthturnera sp.]